MSTTAQLADQAEATLWMSLSRAGPDAMSGAQVPVVDPSASGGEPDRVATAGDEAGAGPRPPHGGLADDAGKLDSGDHGRGCLGVNPFDGTAVARVADLSVTRLNGTSSAVAVCCMSLSSSYRGVQRRPTHSSVTTRREGTLMPRPDLDRHQPPTPHSRASTADAAAGANADCAAYRGSDRAPASDDGPISSPGPSASATHRAPLTPSGPTAAHRRRIDHEPAATATSAASVDNTATDLAQPAPPPETGPTLFTPAQAAAMLTVPESWLRRRAAHRQIPCTMLGKHLRFSPANLAQIITDATRAAHGPAPSSDVEDPPRRRRRRAAPGQIRVSTHRPGQSPRPR